MKRFFVCLFMAIMVLTASAEGYRVQYDAQTRQLLNFDIQVNATTLVIGQRTYSLRTLGSIYNADSGLTFRSYSYSDSELMFCVSTETITTEISPGKYYTGYLILVDKNAYLARKL